MVEKILFIHHSTGSNLIKEGNFRKEIKKLNPNIQFWDHNYNLSKIFSLILANFTHLKGLSDNNGKITGRDFNIYVSNNSPKEYADIFSRDLGDSTLKSILSFDTIIFKNCYPTTRITSDNQLEEDKEYFKKIKDCIDKYSTKKFIYITPPPARKNTTNQQNARRAKSLITWLTSKEYNQEPTNLHIFDMFSLLSDNNGYLKKCYERPFPWDSHPNRKANETISPILARYIVEE